MCKKFMFLISLVLVLGLVSSVWAADYNYTGEYPWSYLYISPWNWDPVAPYGGPGAGGTCQDTAIFDVAPELCVLDTDIQVNNMLVRLRNFDQELMFVKDANVYICDRLEIRDDPGTATLTLADDAVVSVKSLRVHGDNGDAVINMTDSAQLICRNELRFGDNGGDYFELNMTDDAYLYVGNDDDRMRQNEGEFHIDLSANAVMEVSRIRARARLEGVTDTITVRDNAQLICYSDYLRLAGGGSNMTVTVQDNAIVEVDGDFYFGEDNDFAGQAVLNMMGGLITMHDGFGFIDDGSATGFTTVNLTGGVMITEGELWSETDNWVVNVCGGVWAIDGDVVDEIRDQEAEGHWVACPGENCRGEFGSLAYLMVEYDTVEYPGMTKVWSYSDPEQAWGPSPADGATDVPSVGTMLCWCPGASAEVHHVFLSTDEAAVVDGSAFVATLHGHDNTCYDPGALLLGATYYWRVDEQADATIVEGAVWEFTVEDCRMIEDFEAYSYNPNLVYETWMDGCGYWIDPETVLSNGTGSCVDLTMANTHDGAKALVYTYENTFESLWERDANYSEAWRGFDPALNLATSNEAALVLWFFGDRNNDSTDMWVQVKDSAAAVAKHVYGTYGDDPEDIKNEEWADWNIALADLAVDVSAIVRLSIGFGDNAGNVPDDAKGIMLFDDISVCGVRCVPRYTPDIVDLNDDCVTDGKDIGIIADEWLTYLLEPPTP